MAGTMNRVILIGRLGKDAETRSTPSGVSVTSFSVATERRFKRGEEWVSETDWHNVVLWRAEKLAEYLLKGTLVSVEGRLQTRSYEDKDGGKRYATEVVAESCGLLSSADGARRDSGGSGGGKGLVSQPRGSAGRNEAPMADGITDDDVPF